MTIRILIVDDFAVVRQGLHMFLGLDPDLKVVGEAASGAAGLQLARELRPHVVLIDLEMPTADSLSSIAAMRRELPDVEVLALTSVLQTALIVEAIEAGAIGCLRKDTEAEALRKAIKAAAAGRVQLPPEMTARLMQAEWAGGSPQQLTARETEMLRLLAAGFSNQEMAAALALDEQAVKDHVNTLLDKLGVLGRTQAALYAARLGLVGDE
jgi:DNA-binding NarL/FixJ family response regulator